MGVQGATDLVSHSARALLQQSACLQIDFSNAFNTIDRTSMLNRVHSLCPDLAPWCHWCYGAPTPLFSAQNFDDIPSTCGVQQGDPLGPLLFSIGLSLVTESIASIPGIISMWYLDDGFIFGQDLGVLNQALESAPTVQKLAYNSILLNVPSSSHLLLQSV